VFVNVPGADQIAVIDRASMKLSGTWPVKTASANYPMSLDEVNHRVFVGCRRPAKVLVLDTTSGKENASFEIVGDTDDLFYDAARKRLYVTGGDGFIDVVPTRAAASSRGLRTFQPLRVRVLRFLLPTKVACTSPYRIAETKEPRFACTTCTEEGCPLSHVTAMKE
jgi:DNA-binding beta-propeller fold protein YncE